ncbi:hypothetical protein [Nonomuraea helvata]|uniref:hypothetical protein n=1 Tax=Nonomuraea helvata TaxID=37484 RepID=UPI003CD07FA9
MEQGVRQGARREKFAWQCAFGLTLSLCLDLTSRCSASSAIPPAATDRQPTA